MLLTVALAVGITSRYVAVDGLGPLDIAVRFILVPVLLAMAVKYGYVNWIVRRRRLDGFGAYLASGEWFPAPAKPESRSS